MGNHPHHDSHVETAHPDAGISHHNKACVPNASVTTGHEPADRKITHALLSFNGFSHVRQYDISANTSVVILIGCEGSTRYPELLSDTGFG